jgi:hypothetical protein
MTHDAALSLWTALRDRVMAGEVALPEVFDQLSAHISASVPVSGAGLLITSSGRRRAVLGASDERMHRLEQLQATFDQGPCMDAVRSGRFVGEPDLARARTRWPRFRPAAIDGGIAAVFSFPVHVGDLTLGALDCYSVDVGALTPTQVGEGGLFADIAADLIMHAQADVGVDAVVEQMAAGDVASEELERATGITAVQVGVRMSAADELLRRHARDHGISLDEVAAAIIAGTLRVRR